MAESDSPAGRAFHLHLVSDSTGETIHSVARACLVQFDDVEPVEHAWPMARTQHAMSVVLDGIKDKPGPVMYTLVDDGLRKQLRDGCRRLKVPCISVLDPVIAAFGNFLGAQPLHRIGGQHEMDAEYFQRIEAMEWALAHDDGQRSEEYELCSEDLGCDALRQEYRDACLVRDRDELQCRDARQAFRSCLAPCKAALADDGAQCKSELQACFADECEVQERWRRLFERLRRDR